ncbi:uncharacterized protein LOC144113780 isoform X1 [Amblyomma americanum]
MSESRTNVLSLRDADNEALSAEGNPPLGDVAVDHGPPPAGSLVRSSSAWMGVNWPLQNWSTARRGHSDGHVIPRDAATSTSCENVAVPTRQATVKRKRVVDVGQKTVKQMNELARYVNAKGPCAICKTPGAVVTLTQIKRRRRKFMRYWSKQGGPEESKGSPDVWPPDSTPLLVTATKSQKSVSWIEHHEVQRDVGPDFMNSETGAFLLLLSVVALVVGILVIVKATENSLKEYLGLITPTVSLSSALPVGSEELSVEQGRPSTEDVPAQPAGDQDELRLAQEAAARQIQRWYRRCQGSPRAGLDADGARRKRVDRWAQSLRSFFSRKKINHIRAGFQKRWGKKRADRVASEGADDLAPLEANEVLTGAGSVHSVCDGSSPQPSAGSQQDAAVVSSTSNAGSLASRSRLFPNGGVQGVETQRSSTCLLQRSRDENPVIGRSRSAQ